MGGKEQNLQVDAGLVEWLKKSRPTAKNKTKQAKYQLYGYIIRKVSHESGI